MPNYKCVLLPITFTTKPYNRNATSLLCHPSSLLTVPNLNNKFSHCTVLTFFFFHEPSSSDLGSTPYQNVNRDICPLRIYTVKTKARIWKLREEMYNVLSYLWHKSHTLNLVRRFAYGVLWTGPVHHLAPLVPLVSLSFLTSYWATRTQPPLIIHAYIYAPFILSPTLTEVFRAFPQL